MGLSRIAQKDPQGEKGTDRILKHLRKSEL